MWSRDPACRIAPSPGLEVVKLYINLLLLCVQSCGYSDSVLGPISKKKGLKDKNSMYLYSFFMVMYKKNDICLEMKHAFIVKLIMIFNF